MENQKLPWKQILSTWENIIRYEKLTSSILTFYIKSDFVITNKRFIAHYPKTVLWFIPMWFNNSTFNLKQISNVNIDIEYDFLKLILWIIFILVFPWNLHNIWVWLFLLILWIILIVWWIQVYIKVATSWWLTKCPVVFYEKWKAENLVKELNYTIAENS